MRSAGRVSVLQYNCMPTEGGPAPGPASLPDKLYFRIGEVARLVGVEQYVLRYWEKVFPRLAPRKSEREHRLYRRKDVELALEIKHLLYEKRYTIEGARKYLAERSRRGARKAEPAAPVQGDLFGEPCPLPLEAIRAELDEILNLLR